MSSYDPSLFTDLLRISRKDCTDPVWFRWDYRDKFYGYYDCSGLMKVLSN